MEILKDPAEKALITLFSLFRGIPFVETQRPKLTYKSVPAPEDLLLLFCSSSLEQKSARS